MPQKQAKFKTRGMVVPQKQTEFKVNTTLCGVLLQIW